MKGTVTTGFPRRGALMAPLVVVIAAALGATVLAAPARAAITFNVNSFDDRRDANVADNVCRTSAGDCSLRAAIQQANATAGADTIRLPEGTYRLGFAGGVRQSAATLDPADNSRDLDITDSVTIATNGSYTVIDGGRFSSIFEVNNSSAVVNMRNLTITNGGEDDEGGGLGWGGGLRIRGGSVHLYQVTVRDNATTQQGGGIGNAGSLTLVESTVDNNRSASLIGGGGRSSVGGGIFNFTGGSLRIDRSTISNNLSLRGGGIGNASGRVTITNSTISGNTARNSGGGIANYGEAATLNIGFSTIVGNQANVSGVEDEKLGGGIANFGGQVYLGGTILAGNTDNRDSYHASFTPDCYSADASRLTSYRNNVIGLVAGSCVVHDYFWGDRLIFDRVSRDPAAPLKPRVGDVAHNGGATTTRLPLGGSPAVDFAESAGSGTVFDCPGIDQRGVSRPRDGDSNGTAVCDSGSVEIG